MRDRGVSAHSRGLLRDYKPSAGTFSSTNNHLEDPLVSGGVVDGLVAVVRGVGVAPHRQDVQVRVPDP